MKLIAGLGNPGKEYAQSKHNIGFMLLDALAARWQEDAWREKESALALETRFAGEKVLLVKPLTYMNESGRAVGSLLSWYKLSPEDLLVIHDDLDLPMGTVRIRGKGGSGGHNGMKSVIAHVGSENFPRIRIGIGRPKGERTVVAHVLSGFSQEEQEKIAESVNYLLPAVECILTDSVDNAMNRFNPRKGKGVKENGEG